MLMWLLHAALRLQTAFDPVSLIPGCSPLPIPPTVKGSLGRYLGVVGVAFYEFPLPSTCPPCSLRRGYQGWQRKRVLLLMLSGKLCWSTTWSGRCMPTCSSCRS